MKYFENVKTLEELKKEYKKLALKLHPDVNKETDTTEQFKEMQNEYETLFDKVKNQHRNAQGDIYEKDIEETVNEYRDIIDQIIFFTDCTIEIIGSWIWISGNTKNYKEKLKELKFRWASNKKAWSYHNGTYRKQTKKKYSLEDLRNSFENAEIKTKQQNLVGEPA